MVRNKRLFLSLIFLSVVTVSCEQASDTLVDVPNVMVSCLASDSAVCSTPNSGARVQVRMTRSGCENLNFEPVASASALLTCDASGCVATVGGNWIDDNGNPVEQILNGSMSLCGLVDLDNDGISDSGEVEASEDVSIQSSDTITLENWEDI